MDLSSGIRAETQRYCSEILGDFLVYFVGMLILFEGASISRPHLLDVTNYPY